MNTVEMRMLSRLPFNTLWAAILPLALAQTCSQYGTPDPGSCLCPAGFSPSGLITNNCSLPVCGGSLYNPGPAAPVGARGYGNLSLDANDCACAAGFSGPSCTVCQSSNACRVSLNRFLNSSNSLSSGSLNQTMTCSQQPTTYAISQMSCNVEASLLKTLFPGDSTLTITRALNSTLSPGGQNALKDVGLVGGDNMVYAQLWYNGAEQFYCQASGCQQTVKDDGGSHNASTWVCPTLNCTCPPTADFCGGDPKATSLAGTINILKGPLTIDCSGTDLGNCSFNSPFLGSVFGTQGLGLSGCSFGECVQQYVIDQAMGIDTAVSSGNGLSGGVIAGLAVVGVILLAIVGIVIWGFVMQRRARRSVSTDGSTPKSGGVGVKWTGVGYEVNVARRPWDRAVVWLKGSGKAQEPAQTSEGGQAVGPNGGRIVLRDSYGQIPPGGLVCILGPSGAGKSTLVDILAGKRKSGKVEGFVGFTHKHGRVRIGYVDQSDVLSPTSTVLETLIFAAKLRLPESVPLAVKEDRARIVIEQLGLEHVSHTRVGSTEHRGISGAAPDVLVLDEPTSGLDSVSAARLVKLLKGLTEGPNRTTIIASIHQPSSALYQSFDQVVLLAQGRQLYFGPGKSRPAEWFASHGRPCPPGYNIADHLLEIASSPSDLPSGAGAVMGDEQGSNGTASSRTSDGKDHDPLERHLSLDQNDTPLAEKRDITYPPQTLLKDAAADTVDLAKVGNHSRQEERGWWPRSQCATTFLTQIEVLSGREWRNLKRDKTLLIAHVFFACIIGIFAGGLYFKVGLTIAGFQNRVGSLFFLGSLIAFSSLSALYNLVEVRGLFLRERAGSFYSPQAWLLSRIMFDVLPLRLLPTVLVSIIVYFMVGLSRHADRFFKYLLILVEYSLGMTLFNFLLACVFTHGGVAILLSSLCNLFLMTYAGFFVNLGQIPPVLRWLRYFSTLGYTLEALAVNEVGAGLMIVDVLAGVPIEINAEIIMQTLFGFKLENYYRDVLVLFAFIAGYAILLVGAVVFLLRERR